MKNYIVKHNNDLFENAFDGLFRPFYQTATKDLMRTDVKETETEYKFDIEVPGFNKEDIHVAFENETVTVSAKREVKEEDEKNYIRQERNYACERSFYVGDVDETKIKAKYENGVLALIIPKEQPQKPEVHTICIE